MLPANVQYHFTNVAAVHSYATRHRIKNNVYKRKVAKTAKQLCLSVKGVTLWNDLEPCFKNVKSKYGEL